MPSETPCASPQQERVILDILESIEHGHQKTQRDLSQEFGVALGMINAYLKYCIRKGHVRVKKIPSRRYLYLLTPQGFAEKSRLSLKLISNSLTSFRKAREDYDAAFSHLKSAGYGRIALVGQSELSEIAILCALKHGVTPAAVIDPDATNASFGHIPVFSAFDAMPDMDSAVVTDLRQPQLRYEQAVARLGAGRVIAPSILGVRVQSPP